MIVCHATNSVEILGVVDVDERARVRIERSPAIDGDFRDAQATEQPDQRSIGGLERSRGRPRCRIDPNGGRKQLTPLVIEWVRKHDRIDVQHFPK